MAKLEKLTKNGLIKRKIRLNMIYKPLKDEEIELTKKYSSLFKRLKKIRKDKESLNRELKTIDNLLKWIEIPLCNGNYYSIRGGGCRYGEINPHGDVYCRHPYCRA